MNNLVEQFIAKQIDEVESAANKIRAKGKDVDIQHWKNSFNLLKPLFEDLEVIEFYLEYVNKPPTPILDTNNICVHPIILVAEMHHIYIKWANE